MSKKPKEKKVPDGFYSFCYSKHTNLYVTVEKNIYTNNTTLFLKPTTNNKLQNNQIFYLYFNESEKTYSIFS